MRFSRTVDRPLPPRETLKKSWDRLPACQVRSRRTAGNSNQIRQTGWKPIPRHWLPVSHQSPRAAGARVWTATATGTPSPVPCQFAWQESKLGARCKTNSSTCLASRQGSSRTPAKLPLPPFRITRRRTSQFVSSPRGGGGFGRGGGLAACRRVFQAEGPRGRGREEPRSSPLAGERFRLRRRIANFPESLADKRRGSQA
jgi:hypothetical protein